MSRKPNTKCASDTQRARGFYAAVMYFHNLFNYRQAQPCSTRVGRSRFISPVKALKNVRKVSLAYANPCITDLDQDVIALGSCVYSDCAALSSIGQSIFYEICQCSVEYLLIAKNE